MSVSYTHLDVYKRQVFKDKSPSCGVYRIYDGSFTGKTCEGSGVTTAILRKYSISLFSNEQIR